MTVPAVHRAEARAVTALARLIPLVGPNGWTMANITPHVEKGKRLRRNAATGAFIYPAGTPPQYQAFYDRYMQLVAVLPSDRARAIDRNP